MTAQPLRAVLFDLGNTLWQARQNPDGPDREPFSDALPALRELKAQGLRLGIVSDQTDGTACRARLDYWGMTSLFDVIALSCEVGCDKPNPRLFRVALHALGVEPHEAVMVGDNLQADVAGALALGMRSIWRRLPGQELDANVEPDAIIESLAELPGILARWR